MQRSERARERGGERGGRGASVREKEGQTDRQTDREGVERESVKGSKRARERGTERDRDREHQTNCVKKNKINVWLTGEEVCLLVGCLTSQQHASVSQGRICTDNFTCCHTEIEAADPTFHLTQSQYTDTGPTSPSADPITPGAWQGSHWSANV